MSSTADLSSWEKESTNVKTGPLRLPCLSNNEKNNEENE
jgi:hypothetical protein